jgi:predicted ATP-grasp superfamily ATP-dependent carboligase
MINPKIKFGVDTDKLDDLAKELVFTIEVETKQKEVKVENTKKKKQKQKELF